MGFHTYQNTAKIALLVLITLSVCWQVKSDKTSNSTFLHKRAESLWTMPPSESTAQINALLGYKIEDYLPYLNEGSGNATRLPWTGGYWPSYNDSINFRTGNDYSPAEKFGQIARYDLTGIVSGEEGLGFYKDYPTKHPNECVGNEQYRNGKCIPDWHGICDGRTDASAILPNPQCSVQVNDVLLTPKDLKALSSYALASAKRRGFHNKCYEKDEVARRIREERHLDSNCMAMNAGTLHLMLANVIGKRKSTLAMDLNANTEVWNYPVHSYTFREIRRMSCADAYATYNQTLKFDDNAVMVIEFVTNIYATALSGNEVEYISDDDIRASYTTEKQYWYLVEVDINEFVLGGEYLGKSVHDHPSGAWDPSFSTPNTKLKDGMLNWLKPLFERSAAC